MLYIFTATYYEASAWISRYSLKRDTSVSRFQVFYNEQENIRVTITGTGMVSAAAAVSSICTAVLPGKQDFLLNIGICAESPDGHGQIGELFLCHKITETVTGKTFYPDILYRHNFKEAELLTGAKPFQKGMWHRPGFFVYDMEASAIYQAGSYFFSPHQMVFLKIVSDNGCGDRVTPEQVKGLCALHMDSVADYASRLCTIGRVEKGQDFLWDGAVVDKLCCDMCCSATMALSVKQHIIYCQLAGVDFRAVIQEMYQAGKLPCRTKKEGKRCFEEFRQRLL